MKRLIDPKLDPPGSRRLIKKSFYAYDGPEEVTVVEWLSDGTYVKLKYDCAQHAFWVVVRQDPSNVTGGPVVIAELP